jgi:peptide/nickel transport system ATP-binding protein
MRREKILAVENLEICFQTDETPIQAVREIDFELFRGETLGIVGESGSGKSVTALSIMRLLPEASVSGNIRFYEAQDRGTKLTDLPENRMRVIRGRRIAMIFQEPMSSLNPVLRCGDQIAETLQLHQKVTHQEARKRTMALLRQVQLADPGRIYKAYPHQLSGGQRQRVMIAMALSGNPDILIADEPTTALDVTVQKAILELIRELKSEWGGSVIFISHDLGVMAEVADRVLVMQKGEIVERGTVADIFDHPRKAYTKGLLACRPPLSCRPRRLPLIADFTESRQAAGAGVRDCITPEKFRERLQELTKQPPLLSVRSLRVWYENRRNFWGRPFSYVKAVDGVSFDIYPGETLGLVGESGCGKTTLGRALLQLVPLRTGHIRYRGQELQDLSHSQLKSIRKELQIVFQDPYSSLNPRRPVGAVIAEAMKVHRIYPDVKACREKTIDLLQEVGLAPEAFNRYPHEFSGGQRQRICIARALAVNPRLLICDESVSALDVSVQAQVLNLLMDLREKFRLTLLFISHDLSVVKMMSDRMMVMHQGKIEEIGPADDIYQTPASPYTRKLIEAIPKGR